MSIIDDLYELGDRMTQIAADLRQFPDENNKYQRHADELDGAAKLCLEWAYAIKLDWFEEMIKDYSND